MINLIEEKRLDKETEKVVELATQLMKKDQDKDVDQSTFYNYVVKAEDKLWKNKNRNYYIHNVPLESISNDAQVRENILKDKRLSSEEIMLRKEKFKKVSAMMTKLTRIQRKRYLMYYYHDMSMSEIAAAENVSINSVKKTLNQVRRKMSK